jgi:hypothetical protein
MATLFNLALFLEIHQNLRRLRQFHGCTSNGSKKSPKSICERSLNLDIDWTSIVQDR